MIVLSFNIPNQLSLEIDTSDIEYAWTVFSKRINNAMCYSSYEFDQSGVLRVYSPTQKELVSLPNDCWKSTFPVFFDIYSYNFSFHFFDVKEGTQPKIVHQLQSVSDSFFTIKESSNRFRLISTINFLNESGRFSFEINYTNKAGNNCSYKCQFDVVSYKMDTKSDGKIIFRELRQWYEQSLFRFSTLTTQQFDLEYSKRNQILWLLILKELFVNFIAAIRYICNSSHTGLQIQMGPCRVYQIKQWRQESLCRYINDLHIYGSNSIRKFYLNNSYESTVDNKENRFVKYALFEIYHNLSSVINVIENNTHYYDESFLSKINEFQIIKETLKSTCENHFFDQVGRYDGIYQNSLVLQQKPGYNVIYKDWILLRQYLGEMQNLISIGTYPMWKLYELWCFESIKKIVSKCLGVDFADNHQTHNQSEFQFFANQFFFRNNFKCEGENGDIIEIIYQAAYTPNSSSECKSFTVKQIPDIVLNIHKKDITMTYIFDAKYRLSYNEYSPEMFDTPTTESINDMHTYRDAIYFEDSTTEQLSRQIIGAYVLFPGRLKDEQFYMEDFLGENSCQHKLPEYIQSIKRINVGAFPLLPCEESGVLLKAFICKLLNDEKFQMQQISSAIHQRSC